MAQTLEEIATQLRAEFPEIREDRNGELYVLSDVEYEDRILEWAQHRQDEQLEDSAEVQRKSVRDQVRLALSTLADDRTQLDADYAAITDTSVSMTGNQIRPYLARMNRIMRHMSVTQSGLIRTLIDRAMIEPE